MNHSIRRAFFYFYLFLFLVTAPLIVLYTAGYRYNPSLGKIVYTGALSVTSIPRGASMFLDEKRRSKKTPVILKHVIPGTYILKLEKDGYYPLERQIEIMSRSTTEVHELVLFLKSEAELIRELKLDTLASDPKGELLAYIIITEPWAELLSFNKEKNIVSLLDRIVIDQNKNPELFWSENGENLYLLFSQDEIRTYTRSGNLVAETQTEMTLKAGDATFTFINEQTEVVLERDSFGNKKTIALLAQGSYDFLSWQNPYLLIKEDTKERLLLINTGTDEAPILLNTHANQFDWHDNKLIYSDGFEIHIFDPQSSTDTLISRFGESILNFQALSIGQTLLIAFSTHLIAFDISNLNTLVRTDLLETDSIKTFWLNKREKTVSFYGTHKEKTGIFNLNLIEGSL